jgi:hypothetical protein
LINPPIEQISESKPSFDIEVELDSSSILNIYEEELPENKQLLKLVENELI